MSDYSVLDIENDGDRLMCIGWKGEAHFPRLGKWSETLADLANPDIAKIVFTKYDHLWLLRHGIEVRGPIIDVQVMAWVVNERTDLDLESCAARYCDITMDKRIVQRAGELFWKRNNGELVPLGRAPKQELARYNVRDLEATEAVFHELLRLIRAQGLMEYYETDVLPLTQVLLDMELAGLPVDVEGAKVLDDDLREQMTTLEESLRAAGNLPDDFNLGSSKQLGDFLYSRTFQHKRSIEITPTERTFLKANPGRRLGRLKVERVGRLYAHGTETLAGLNLESHGTTKGGAPSTDAPTLRVHHGDHDWVREYLSLAERRTLSNVFLKAIIEQSVDGRLYGRLNQTGTKTGRLSSSGPNLQNMPARGDLGLSVRKLFRPEPGMNFVHGDYSQLEPRLMAHFSGDPALRQIYEDDEDIYLMTAMRVFNCSLEDAMQYRDPMKVYVLAMGYGSGASTLRKQLAIAGHNVPLPEVKAALNKLKQVYSRFFDWKEQIVGVALNEGYVETLAGRRRRFGGRAQSWRDHGEDERQAVNAVIQGSAADIVARAMCVIHREVPEVRMLVQVHDEILMESSEDVDVPLAKIQAACETGHGFNLDVPLTFEPRIIPTWAAAKED